MKKIFYSNEFNPASYDAGFEDGKNTVTEELISKYLQVFGDITLSELLARIQELEEQENRG